MNTMTRFARLIILSAAALLLWNRCATGADATAGKSALGAGFRYHMLHEASEDWPFGDRDLSYGIAYEWRESVAYWQLAVNYAPDVSGEENVDYVILPQLNLIFKDKIWRGGVGILDPYVEVEDVGGDWRDLHWQFLLGIGIPIMSQWELGGHACHVFDKWSNVGEFEFGEVEYTFWLTRTL